MQLHNERSFLEHSGPNMLPHYQLMAEVVSHHNPFLGGELARAMSLDNNQSLLRVEGPFANTTHPEDASRILAEWTIDPQEYNNNPTNPTLTHVAPGTMPSFQLPSLSSDSHTIPIINSEDRSFRCSWYSHGSVAQCYHALPDRLAFLRHLSVEHQVSGSQDGKIVCRLFDSKTGSVCNTPIKRGNFPRHADRHYHVRLHCQHCPSGKSFSRQDSWKRHMESKHGA